MFPSLSPTAHFSSFFSPSLISLGNHAPPQGCKHLPSLPKHLSFGDDLNMAMPGLVNLSQNLHFHLLGPQIPELRDSLGSPIPLAPSWGNAGHRGHVCGHTPAAEALLHRHCLAQGVPAHTSRPTRTCPPHTQFSPARSRNLRGSQTAWQMLPGLAPTQAHTHTAAASPSVLADMPGPQTPPGQSLAGPCPSSCCTQGRMVLRVSRQWQRNPDGNWGPRC